MIIRQDFQEMPPKAFMMQVMDDLLKTYCFLWERKDKDSRFFITWNDLKFIYNKNSFRTALRKLCTEGLLDYNETQDGIQVELVNWDDIPV